MKAKTGMPAEQAVREFTDREEPRAAFWKQYRLLEQELQTQQATGEGCDVHVLTYYGIGGIGKSTLLQKLRQELEEQVTKPIYALYNFENGSQDSRRVLERLRTRLMEKAKFVFPLLDLGLYVYSQKMGEPADSPEVKQFSSQSPVLSLALSAMEFIPVLGCMPQILKIADESQAFFRTHLKKHNKELTRMEYMEPEELYAHLPMLFALDMQHNLEKSTKPVVIFLDTYEKLVNEMSQVGIPLKNDEWIRGENGIVQNIPGVLWVIAGREKLKWVQFDPDWDTALEQHILGNLSITDSTGFLEKAGVGGAVLREQLYKLTQGTPVYLDLCVDQFMRIAQRGETPTIDMFGGNIDDLIERFVRYMSDAQKDTVYMLSCLQTWTPELIDSIGSTILPNFSITSYTKTKEYSFISLADDGKYSMHQTVGEVLLKDCPEALRLRAGKALAEKYAPVLQMRGFMTQEFADALLYMTRAALLLHNDRQALLDHLRAQLLNYITDAISAGQRQIVKPCLELLSSRCEENREDLLYALYLQLVASLLYDQGLFRNALDHRKTALDIYTAVLGSEDLQTLRANYQYIQAMGNLAMFKDGLAASEELLEIARRTLPADHPFLLSIILQRSSLLSSDGKYQEALPLVEDVLQKRIAQFGEESMETTRAELNLSNVINRLGRHQESYDYALRAYEKRCRLLGRDHPDTLAAQNEVANALGVLGKDQESLESHQDLLERRRRVLGEEHPATVSSIHNVSVSLSILHRYEESLVLELEALELYRRYYGDAHPKFLRALNNITIPLRRLNRHEEALPYHKQAVEGRRKTLGPDHPETLSAMITFANTLNEMGKLEDATALVLEAMTKMQTALGLNHPKTLNATSLYGRLLVRQKNLTEGIPLLEDVLARRRETAQPDSTELVNAIRVLADAYQRAGRSSDCAKLWAEVYEIRCRTQGEEDSATIEALERYIHIEESADHLQGLPKWYDKLVDIRTRVNGAEDLKTALALSKRGILYSRLRQFAKAQADFEQALQIRSKTLGDGHPHTINVLSNLANNYSSQGKCKEALAVHETILKFRREKLGEEHPDTLSAKLNVALTYEDMKAHFQAKPILEELLETNRRLYGENHPSTASVLLSYANNCHFLGQSEKALPLYQTVLEVCRQTLPAGHLRTIAVLNNIAILLSAQGKHEEALPMKQEVYEIRRKKLGIAHPLTLGAMRSLLVTLKALGQEEEARKLQLLLTLYTGNKSPQEEPNGNGEETT